jgi:hypothetical protein
MALAVTDGAAMQTAAKRRIDSLWGRQSTRYQSLERAAFKQGRHCVSYGSMGDVAHASSETRTWHSP